MARGDVYMAERIDHYDEATGLLVRQVTSSATPSLHLHYETPTFTPDGERMLVVTKRSGKRGSPFDLFSMRVNGDEPTQLSSDGPTGVGSPTMTVDGTYALYMEGGVCHRTNLATADDEELGCVEGGEHYTYDFGARTPEGGYYFTMVKRNGKLLWVRWNLKTGGHDVIVEADMLNHPMANPGGPEISVLARHREADGSLRAEHLQLDGTTLEPLPVSFPDGPHGMAHSFWLGKSGKFQGTQLPPGNAVQVMERDAEDVTIVADGPYFWHSGASTDGEWIVADTNWPDDGLWLINVETKRRARLCYSGASQGYPQWTHLHANLNDDGTMAVFDSDRTGITQVYVVEVPPDMRNNLRTHVMT